MDNSALFEQIVSKLKLKSDMMAVLVCLEEFTSSFFAPKGQERVTHLFDALPDEAAVLVRDLLLKNPVTPENQTEIKRTIEALADRVRECKIVEMTIAFQADEDAVSVFSEWIKRNLTPDTLIDLSYDKTIVGGALIASEGKYKDYSVRKNLAGRFQIQRDEIMNMVK